MSFHPLFNRVLSVTAAMSLVATVVATSLPAQAETVPDFASYTDVKQKKKAFFDFMYPKIVQANKKVLETRGELVEIDKALSEGESLSASQTKKVQSICDKYRAGCGDDVTANVKNLLSRVDVVPPSLALAQAANESSWGTSRFAKQGNNYFGQWCFEKGCGIVPARRNAGTTHEVRKFKDALDSVAGYVYNLNTGNAYATVRKNRADSRANGQNPSSLTMVKGLTKYSERGQEYVKEITSMITYNKLETYDDRFWSEVK